MVMKTIILGTLLVSFTLLTGCASKTAQNIDTTYIYTEDDNFKSKRVDYLGSGLGGQGLGGYGVGGYGLIGYAGQMPE